MMIWCTAQEDRTLLDELAGYQNYAACPHNRSFEVARPVNRPLSFKPPVGFGKEDQDAVPVMAAAKHGSCWQCASRRLGIRTLGRLLPGSRRSVRTLRDRTEQSRPRDGAGGRIPCVVFHGHFQCFGDFLIWGSLRLSLLLPPQLRNSHWLKQSKPMPHIPASRVTLITVDRDDCNTRD